VESVLGHHARLFAQHGHRVRVVAARGAGPSPAIEFYSLPLADSRHARVLAAKEVLDRGRVPADFGALRDEIAAALLADVAGADVLIAHNVCSLAKNLALTAALYDLYTRPGFPRLILWHHDLAWTTPRYRSELHEGRPWDLLRDRWPGATHVVISSLRRAELAELTGLAAASIHVAPNGVDLDAFFKLERQTVEFVRRLGLAQAAPLLLLPVRLTPRKNVELALRVLAALRRTHPHAALVVTGPQGPHNPANREYYARLLALRDELGLRGCAHLLAEVTPKYLPDAVIADFYRLADALLLPSREEGFGIPLLEAAFSRLPVFCTDIAPLRELGGEDVTYFDPDAEPEAVARLLAARLDGDPAARFAARARRHYTWEGVYATFIEPILEQRA
jgi:glycosyltransferase involved in cell wall biosynthesis